MSKDMNQVVKDIFNTPMIPIIDPNTNKIIVKNFKNSDINSFLENEFQKCNLWDKKK